jgi:hypothetical protein
VGDGAGEFGDLVGEVEVASSAGFVEAGEDEADLAAQGPTCTARAAGVTSDGDGSGGFVMVLLAVCGGWGWAATGEVGHDLRLTDGHVGVGCSPTGTMVSCAR